MTNHSNADSEFLGVEEKCNLEIALTAFTFYLIRIALFLFMVGLPFYGLSQAYIYENSHERSVEIIGKERDFETDVYIHSVRIEISHENFPDIPRHIIDKERQVSPDKLINVGQHFYDKVRRGDEINIEYREGSNSLSLRHADDQMPTWLYFLLSFFCFIGLVKTNLKKKP